MISRLEPRQVGLMLGRMSCVSRRHRLSEKFSQKGVSGEVPCDALLNADVAYAFIPREIWLLQERKTPECPGLASRAPHPPASMVDT